MHQDEVAGPGGRTVVVTGGTSGIGAAIARRFAADGDEVVVAGLDADRCAGELPSAVRAVELDVTRAEALSAFLDGLDGLDVLVNAAGVIARGREYEPDVFAEVVGVNLTGTMRSCVAARKALADTGGCIVNVASMLSYFGGPKVPAYSSSKGGVMQLTKSLAVAWADQGIRVNAVAPGWIRTPLTRDLQEDPENSRRIIDRTPMGRWGTPAEIAGAVAFLAGPDAGFITGAVLAVDGGYLAA
ncbi:SDR family oxidoreductase [Streptomyces sp. NBC_00006]|uniref:SDR family NAD(P)-dependent oxidoreductase n=1 Tax=unclassified Streptomyces TaxID=2593676 RepID=UPI002256AB72|nr:MULTISPECIES: SDR family oxidoreductase [unclassified Streptomyces]MCX4830549.1 SDR family oxidoreductase [Streptomyces sp. NBC_01016]MCX5530151.1 SDR family oxidoreductase [Streptomyces sp. NBC_00006]